MFDAQLLVERLGSRFGLELIQGTRLNKGILASLRVDGIDSPNGFRVDIISGWRSVDAIFVPDTFAAGLLRAICASSTSKRAEFSALAATFSQVGVRCLPKVDGRETPPDNLPNGNWMSFELTCSRLTDQTTPQTDAEDTSAAALAMLLSLLPVEQDCVESPMAQGLPEGVLIRVEVNRYERSPANRAAAIIAHGAFCHACGFDFGQFYGRLGEGFIEVHHRVPVSSIGEDYIIDPIRDLIPLCANCHQMVHRRNPPLTPEQLHEELTAQGLLREVNNLTGSNH